MILLRTTEAPKTRKEEIQRKFPDYKVIGDKAGWFYPVEQTKVVLVSVGWKTLVKETREHLRGNDLPVPPDLNEQMMAWYCSTVGGVACGEPPPVAPHDLRALAERFLRTAKKFVFDGGQKVPQEEAERRAAICATCPKNTHADWCSGCFLTSLTASAVKMVSGWTTSQDAKLQSCSVCGCRLSLKTHLSLESMRYRELDGLWPDHCWAKPEPKEAL